VEYIILFVSEFNWSLCGSRLLHIEKMILWIPPVLSLLWQICATLCTYLSVSRILRTFHSACPASCYNWI